MRSVVHLDRLTWRLDASSVKVPPNLPGFVDLTGVATRVGVFQYATPGDPSTPFLEWRPAEEVLEPESLESLVGVPFTLDHPAVDVTSENMQALTHGWVLEVWADGDLVYVRVRVGTESAKRMIEAGTIELSCGYSAELEEVEGYTPSGEAYHAIQRKIRYNHLALVEAARAGPVARLRLDQLSQLREYRSLRLDSKTVRVLIRASDTMKTITILRKDGRTFEVAGWMRPAIDAAAKQRHTDEISTEEVKIGGTKMVLPTEMVEAMMASVGASAGASAPATPPADEEDPAAKKPVEGEELPLDAAAAEENYQMSAKADSKVKDTIQAAIDRRIDARLSEIRRIDSQRRAIERAASQILPTTYDYERGDEWTAALSAIRLVDAKDTTSADLVEKARKGDGVAAGRLLERLDRAVESKRARTIDSADDDEVEETITNVVTDERKDRRGDSEPATVIPLHEQIRNQRRARIDARSRSLPTRPTPTK